MSRISVQVVAITNFAPASLISACCLTAPNYIGTKSSDRNSEELWKSEEHCECGDCIDYGIQPCCLWFPIIGAFDCLFIFGLFRHILGWQLCCIFQPLTTSKNSSYLGGRSAGIHNIFSNHCNPFIATSNDWALSSSTLHLFFRVTCKISCSMLIMLQADWRSNTGDSSHVVWLQQTCFWPIFQYKVGLWSIVGYRVDTNVQSRPPYTQRHFMRYVATWLNATAQVMKLLRHPVSSVQERGSAFVHTSTVIKFYTSKVQMPAKLSRTVVQALSRYSQFTWIFPQKHKIIHII